MGRHVDRALAEGSLLGDPHHLVWRLGSPEVLDRLSGVAQPFALIRDRDSLRHHLRQYQAELLLALEFPAIVRAFHHANRHEIKELIALDREMAREPKMRRFASASVQIGRAQLRGLHPLRDHRVVRRFYGAVEAGQAHGCHAVIYGLVLSVFSIALPQGMLKYAQNTSNGFVFAANLTLCLPESEIHRLLADNAQELAAAIGHWWSQHQTRVRSIA